MQLLPTLVKKGHLAEADLERVKEAQERVTLAKRNGKLLADLPIAERMAALRLVGFRADFDASRTAIFAFFTSLVRAKPKIRICTSGIPSKISSVPLSRKMW